MAVERPLSPHLQVYRLPLVANLSILHRITGLWLSFGGVLLVAWVLILAQGPDWYEAHRTMVAEGWTRIVVCVLLYTFVFSLVYHLLNGVRHLFWDAGKGLDIEFAGKTGWLVVGLSVLLTALIAWRALSGGGA